MPPNSNDTAYVPSSGIKYPRNRDVPHKNIYLWLKDKREDDGAEGLWRIHDKLYDLNDFIKSHPGGQDWLIFTKGTDITEAFEAHHLSDRPEEMLPRYYVREAREPRNYPFTFEEKGFYKTLKRNARRALKEMPVKKISQTSKRIIDTLLILTFLLSATANYTRSYVVGALAAFSLTCTAVAAHNFFHRADNFRMYYFDLCFLSSKEWRISHALSHHLYPNTIADLEISSFEPYIEFLPKPKTALQMYGSWIISPLAWLLLYASYAAKRFKRHCYSGFKHFTILELMPFTLPLVMYIFSGEVLATLGMWLFIVFLSSFHFGFVGLNAAHHHPDIYHDGDANRPRDEKDWGIHQLDAVMDRHDINSNYFLVLTNFGEHGLHHLFPTLDHAVLEKLSPVLIETAKQFNIQLRLNSQLELVKGQFQQIARSVPNPIAKYCNIRN